MTVLYSKEAVKDLIESGKQLVLAGDERILAELPKGNWIAGTIPYFMNENGGLFSQDHVYVTELPDYSVNSTIKIYDQNDIHKVYEDGPEHGFSVIIIPATSKTHLSFSLNAPNFPDFAAKPLIGWISGVFLEDLNKITPKVFDGTTGVGLENNAVVLHVTLPKNKLVEIGIVNIFEQGDGDTLVFPEDSFSVSQVLVNNKKHNFADYLVEKGIDTRLPIVADLCGAMINTSFQSVNKIRRQVDFYAPVFRGMPYKIAKPVENYVQAFRNHIPEDGTDKIWFSCNCILNYLYAELEGKKTEGFTGPFTFGEIAYQLLNQTLAYLSIQEV